MIDKVPRVSIGVPVYNGEAFLEQALDSLLAQSFDDFELIISDNASMDGTEAICRRYEALDSRISYHRQPQNLGAIGNFNFVFEVSRGAYFKWASHDDICRPTFLERCVEVLDRDPSVVWCHSGSRHIDVDGRPIIGLDHHDVCYGATGAPDIEGKFQPSRESEQAYDRFHAVLLGAGGCLDSYGLIRADVIRETPLYLPYYGSEKVFVAELALRGRYKELPETLFFTRVHPDAAYYLNSAAEQRVFINPKAGKRFTFPRLHLLRGYLSAIRRADLTGAERGKCYTVVARYLLQVAKWRSIVRNIVTGAGMGHEHQEHPGTAPEERP